MAEKTKQGKTRSSTGTTKKDQIPASLVKKVTTISDSTKTLAKEIKVMTKIFADNQKVLVSMKNMIDNLTDALEQIQKQTKQINILEEDAQKLYSGLNQVRSQSDIVVKLNQQTLKLQDQIHKIEEAQRTSPETEKLSKQVSDSMDSIKNNSQMIIKIAQRIDEIRDELRQVAAKAESGSSVIKEINGLKQNIDAILTKAEKISEENIAALKQELTKIGEKANSISSLSSEISLIKKEIDSLSKNSGNFDSLGGVIEGLEKQFQSISSKVDSLSSLNGKLQNVESEISTLTKRADSTAFFGEGLKEVQAEVSSFKESTFNRTNTIDQKISTLSDMIKRSDAAATEFHKKTDKVFQELHSLRDVTSKTSSDSSKEMMALLKLSEYQSNIRMNSESKYGEIKDLENMAENTANIVNLFDRISIEAQEKMPLPQEVRQWAVSKILDSADRWEIRFSDVFSILSNKLGKEMLKENIRLQQVRDIYGIRAVDELRQELNIS